MGVSEWGSRQNPNALRAKGVEKEEEEDDDDDDSDIPFPFHIPSPQRFAKATIDND
jgi:hypothetical protein